MTRSLIIKKSKLAGKGVFANRKFKKGEVVIKWSLDKIFTRSASELLPEKEKDFLVKKGNKFILMQPPARYVNHSCEPNTLSKVGCDIAIRDIEKGEEITTDYSKTKGFNEFDCVCGSKKCKKHIKLKR